LNFSWYLIWFILVWFFKYLSGSNIPSIGGSIVDCRYVRHILRSLLICFVFKNFIMGREPTRRQDQLVDSDDEEGIVFLMEVPPAAAAAAPPPIVPVGCLSLYGYVFGL